MKKQQFAMIGPGVMGQNFALNSTVEIPISSIRNKEIMILAQKEFIK